MLVSASDSRRSPSRCRRTAPSASSRCSPRRVRLIFGDQLAEAVKRRWIWFTMFPLEAGVVTRDEVGIALAVVGGLELRCRAVHAGAGLGSPCPSGRGRARRNAEYAPFRCGGPRQHSPRCVERHGFLFAAARRAGRGIGPLRDADDVVRGDAARALRHAEHPLHHLTAAAGRLPPSGSSDARRVVCVLHFKVVGVGHRDIHVVLDGLRGAAEHMRNTYGSPAAGSVTSNTRPTWCVRVASDEFGIGKQLGALAGPSNCCRRWCRHSGASVVRPPRARGLAYETRAPIPDDGLPSGRVGLASWKRSRLRLDSVRPAGIVGGSVGSGAMSPVTSSASA